VSLFLIIASSNDDRVFTGESSGGGKREMVGHVMCAFDDVAVMKTQGTGVMHTTSDETKRRGDMRCES
jgi:hypothetical protein